MGNRVNSPYGRCGSANETAGSCPAGEATGDRTRRSLLAAVGAAVAATAGCGGSGGPPGRTTVTTTDGGSESGTETTTVGNSGSNQRLEPPADHAGDEFGAAIGLDGSVAVVGDPGGSEPNGDDAGVAYAYEAGSDGWARSGRLLPGDGDGGDRFGAAISVAGERALVAAPGDEDPHGERAGSAYVFERGTGGAWDQVAKLVRPEAGEGERFGTGGVVLAGTLAVVGEPGIEDVDEGTTALGGAVHVYDGTDAWSHAATLSAPSARDEFDGFGNEVAAHGDTVLASAPRWDVDAVRTRGGAYAFQRDGDGSWSAPASLVPSSEGIRGDAGTALALHGDVAVVNAPREDVYGTRNQGAAYVFERSGGTWSQTTRLVADDGDHQDRFGIDVDCTGDTAVVGAPRDEDPNGSAAGAAYEFGGGDGGWGQRRKLLPGDGEREDRFGEAVAASEDWLLVAAANAASPAGDATGAVYAFEPSGG